MSKFWIVEYVDVNAPKAERSELCASKAEARRKAVKREAVVHFCDLVSFAGRGLCDSPAFNAAFYNELGGNDARV